MPRLTVLWMSYDETMLLRYEAELNDFVNANYSSVVDELSDKKKIDDDLKAKIEETLNAFKEVFKA